MRLQLVTADKGARPLALSQGNMEMDISLTKRLDEDLMFLFKFHTQTGTSWAEITVRLYRAFMPCLNLIRRVIVINQTFLRIQVCSM